MRCFAAVELPAALREKIVRLQKQIRGDVKLVEQENLHFTLKFFGEIDDKMLEKVKAVLANVASKFKPFDCHIKGAGCFPNEKYIRVIWVGCPEMLPLQEAVEEAFAGIFKKETPVPHLTLARVRSARNMDKVKFFLSENKDADIGTMWVDCIKLKKSTLRGQYGPVYEDVMVFEL